MTAGPGPTEIPNFEQRFPALFAAGYRAAFRVLGVRAPAEDIAAEAVARSFIRWRSVSGYDVAWVTRVAANLALDEGRRRRFVAWGKAAGRPHVDEYHEVRSALRDALARLPRRQREVVALRVLGDLGTQEVADLLGITEGAVKTHLFRGLGSLRKALPADLWEGHQWTRN